MIIVTDNMLVAVPFLLVAIHTVLIRLRPFLYGMLNRPLSLN